MLTRCFGSSNIHRHCFCQLGIAVSDRRDSKQLLPMFPEAEKRKIKELAGLEPGEGLCSGLQEACVLVFSGKGERRNKLTLAMLLPLLQTPNTRNFREEKLLGLLLSGRFGYIGEWGEARRQAYHCP